MTTRIINVKAVFTAVHKPLGRAVEYLMKLARGLMSAFAKVNLVAGTAFGFATKKAFDLQKQAENARMALGTLFQQESADPISFSKSVQVADKVLAQLRQDASKLPGTFDEMRESFTTLLPVLGRAGADLDEIRKIAGLTVVSARLGDIQGGAGTVARDIRQILSGSASAAEISTLQLRSELPKLLALVKKDRMGAISQIGKALAQGNSPIRAITSSLEVQQDALDAYGATFDAQWSTAVEKARELALVASKPLYGAAMRQLARLNTYLDQNWDKVQQIAELWGEKVLKFIEDGVKWVKKELVPFLQKAAEYVQKAAEYWKEIAAIVGGIALGQFVAGLAGLSGPLAGVVTMLGAIAGGLWAINNEIDAINAHRANSEEIGKRAKKSVLGEYEEMKGDPGFAAYLKNQINQKTTTKMLALVSAANTGAEQIAKARKSMNGSRWGTEGASDSISAFIRMSRMSDVERAAEFGLLSKIIGDYRTSNVIERQKVLLRRHRGLEDELSYLREDAPFGVGDPAITLKRGEEEDKGPPKIDARGSTFILNMNLLDGDPDRMALEIPHALLSAFRPEPS